MKVEHSPFLLSCSDTVGSAGSMSPHRSTQDTKDCETNTSERYSSYGEADSLSFQQHSMRNRRRVPRHFTLPRSNDVPVLEDLKPEREDNTEDRSYRVSHEDEYGPQKVEFPLKNDCTSTLSTLPMIRKVSLEPSPVSSFDELDTQESTLQNQQQQHYASRPKRRRNPSLSEESFSCEFGALYCGEFTPERTSSPRKRRRVHERKQAMAAQDFDAIFCQLESMDPPVHTL